MKTVLVVDDEDGIVGVLAAILEDAGYRVRTASNGRQALDSVERERPDLVLSDFMMPLVDGAQLGCALRAEPRWANIPVVMMSAVPEELLRAEFDGYAAFLRKPFDIAGLLEAVAGALAADPTA